jgi:hypothetical protein
VVGKDLPGTKHLRKRDGLVLLPLLKLGGGIDHDDVGVSVRALVDDLGEFGVSTSHVDVCLCWINDSFNCVLSMRGCSPVWNWIGDGEIGEGQVGAGGWLA